MKKLYAVVSALFLFSLANAQWTYVGGPGISSPNNPWPTLALDNNGVPYVAYPDNSNNGNPVVKKYVGGQWTDISDSILSSHVVSSVAIAFDRQNTPYVAFIDDYLSSYESVAVMKYNGTDWSLVGVDDFTDSLVASTQSSLAIDNNGIIYVVYQNLASGSVEVDKYATGSWTRVGNNTPPARWFSNIILDNTGTPYVAYTTGFTNNNYGYVQKWNGSSWVALGGTCFDCGSSGVSYPSLAIDQNNNPYVAYINWNGMVSVKTLSGTGWVSVGSNGFANSNSAYTSIAINDCNIPYVAFEDNSLGQAALTGYDPSNQGWNYVGTGDFSAGEAIYTSLATSSSGTFYVAFNDYANANQALSVMSHAGIACVSGIAETHDQGFQIQPNPTTGEVNITLPNNSQGIMYLRDIAGKLISVISITRESQTLNLENLSAGMYILSIHSEQGMVSRKIVKE